MSTLLTEITAEKSRIIELVLAAQGGDRKAFGALVSKYERGVYGAAYRFLRNDAEAQELTQEVFVQVLRKLTQLRNPACFGGWLKAIVRRMASNRKSRQAPCWNSEPAWLESACTDDETPYRTAIKSERALKVRAGLDRLGSLDRQTLVAFYLDGNSLVEMSDKFESPIGTIKRRLHVARKRLARELQSLDA